MTTVTLSPLAGAGWQFFNDNGDPLAGGKLYVYQAGTNTPITTYTTSAGNVAHTFPIVFDSTGRVPEEIWVAYVGSLKFVLEDSASALIWTKDNIPTNNASAILYNQGNVNAVTRTLQSKLQDVVSVKDFGATGNGVTSDRVAIANAAAASNQIMFPAGTYLIDDDLTLTSAIVMTAGAQFSIANGRFLNIDGPFNAPTATCFTGAGQVVFGNNSAQEVYPEWWGAVAVSSQNSSGVLQTPNDCTSAILSAIRSVRFNWQPSGKAVKFGIGVYGVSSINLQANTLYGQGLTLRGTRSTHLSGAAAVNVGAGGASVLQSVSASSYLIQIDGASGGPNSELHFEDLSFDGKCQKDSVILMQPSAAGPAFVCNYIYFDRCVWHNVKNTRYFVESNANNVFEENALVYFNQCAFQLNSALQPANTGVSIFLQNPGAYNWNFFQCYFSGTAQTNFATIYVQTGGVQLLNCYFEANLWYDIGCLDGGFVHAKNCQSISNRFAFFSKYGGAPTFTSNAGIIIEDLVWVENSGSWAILSDSDQQLTIRNIRGGGVYLRSGGGNAYIENIYGGSVEFGDRSSINATYTGVATLVNVPSFKVAGGSPSTTTGAVTIIEGSLAAELQKFVALDLLSYLTLVNSQGLEAWILSSFKQGVGYKDLYLRARNTILDTGGFQMLTAGEGVVLTTPNGLAKYKITVDNSGNVVSTLVP